MKRQSSFRIRVEDLEVEVVRKRVKNLNLRVTKPHGDIRMSVPPGAGERAARDMIVAHLDWIRHQQAKLRARMAAPPLLYCTGETHYYRGRAYRLEVIEKPRSTGVELLPGRDILCLCVRPGSDAATRERALHAWYRRQMKAAVPTLVAQWAHEMGVSVPETRIKRMKTRWGTCNIRDRRIWLNLELIKRPDACLEYVVVHELAHFFERRHNHRFKRILDETLPDWRGRRDRLNGRL